MRFTWTRARPLRPTKRPPLPISGSTPSRLDLDTNSLQVEQLLETAGVIASGERPDGGEFAI